MPETVFQGRLAYSIETPDLRVTVLRGGGHIAEILDKRTGVNPLWVPPWRSIEPSSYDPARHPEYGGDAESRLLAGIMGHNLCLDVFGAPSEAEAAAGANVHGEGPVADYEIAEAGREIMMRADLPMAGLRFERRLSLEARTVRIAETVENLRSLDRPIAWTQHVTLGPPFLARGSTEFRASATRSKVYERDFASGKGDLVIGAEFDWPHAPGIGGAVDLRVYTDAAMSARFTTHLMDRRSEQAGFVAFSPESGLAFGYVWKRSDFPWLGIWEENCCREHSPWSGRAMTRGMEFGVSPMPESRREMIERGSLFGEPVYRWIPAKGKLRVEYRAFLTPAESIGGWTPGSAVAPPADLLLRVD
jgi:hypothetical protein